jgi:ferredoxin
MDDKTITRDKLKNLMAALSGECLVIAPVNRGDHSLFQVLGPDDEPCFDFLNTKKSVKEQFFPQREQLFSFSGAEIREPVFPDRQKIILGVRPCDARSLTILDHVFNGGDYQDPYYLNNRTNTLVISLGCRQPESTCFCTATGGDPFGTDGSDIMLVDRGDTFLVQAVSEKGTAFVQKHAAFFTKAGAEATKEKNDAAAAARAAVQSDINTALVKQKLDGNFEAPVWEALHEKCLGCGICTFLCPTCHCFDILDEAKGSSGERIRIWDSCMFPLFTLHASGANPRPSGSARLRQRVMHKFKYYVDNNGCIACTGCGRCIQYCPVSMDIRAVLRQIEKL